MMCWCVCYVSDDGDFVGMIKSIKNILGKIRGLTSEIGTPLNEGLQATKYPVEDSNYWMGITGENQEFLKNQLKTLIRNYEVFPYEYLLSVSKLIDFANDLERIGIAFRDITGWYYRPLDKRSCKKVLSDDDPRYRYPMVKSQPNGRCEILAEDSTMGIYIPDKVIFGDRPVSASIAMVRDYVLHEMPSEVAYVTIDLCIPYDWEEEIFFGT